MHIKTLKFCRQGSVIKDRISSELISNKFAFVRKYLQEFWSNDAILVFA